MKPEPMKKKATRKEILQALTHLTELITGNNKDGETIEGNPYCKDVVKRACQIIAKEKGHDSYLNWN